MTTRSELAAMIDHTLLKPEATDADVRALVAEAAELVIEAFPEVRKALNGAGLPCPSSPALVAFPAAR